MNGMDVKDDASSDSSKDLLLEEGGVVGDDANNKGDGDPPSLGTAGDNLAVDPVTEVALQRQTLLHSPCPESAPPLIGGDRFCCLTFGNNPLT